MHQLQEKFQNGHYLLINKPIGWTSFDVVRKINFLLKNQLQIKKIKVGHAGTLDPLATGLLVVCTGKFTKTIDEIQAQEKEYTGIITLGATTPSFDLETAIDNIFPTANISDAEIKKQAETFIGLQMQQAPIHSAKKIDGKRAYEFAREGATVEIKSNQIEIKAFDILAIEKGELVLPNNALIKKDEVKINQESTYKQSVHVHFRIVCSKGTYIRSVARDLGKKLNTGGHLSKLERTRIGNFLISNAQEINNLSFL